MRGTDFAVQFDPWLIITLWWWDMKIERMCQSRWMHYAGGLEEPDNQTTEDEPFFSPQQAPVICILTIFIRHLCNLGERKWKQNYSSCVKVKVLFWNMHKSDHLFIYTYEIFKNICKSESMSLLICTVTIFKNKRWSQKVPVSSWALLECSSEQSLCVAMATVVRMMSPTSNNLCYSLLRRCIYWFDFKDLRTNHLKLCWKFHDIKFFSVFISSRP